MHIQSHTIIHTWKGPLGLFRHCRLEVCSVVFCSCRRKREGKRGRERERMGQRKRAREKRSRNFGSSTVTFVRWGYSLSPGAGGGAFLVGLWLVGAELEGFPSRCLSHALSGTQPKRKGKVARWPWQDKAAYSNGHDYSLKLQRRGQQHRFSKSMAAPRQVPQSYFLAHYGLPRKSVRLLRCPRKSVRLLRCEE